VNFFFLPAHRWRAERHGPRARGYKSSVTVAAVVVGLGPTARYSNKGFQIGAPPCVPKALATDHAVDVLTIGEFAVKEAKTKACRAVVQNRLRRAASSVCRIT